MGEYLQNLLSALLGNNPYQSERDELRRQMEQAAENVERLRDMYCSACEKWEKSEKQVASLQQLVENLRERISDKDVVIAQQQRDYRERSERREQEYQQRIAQYDIEVDALRGELQMAGKKRYRFRDY